ncbi:hypothetical protein F4803DRAFT_566241 [Xylaria telfairii]|nr:hypothetical protein F4803DRAFT_566241 [Xylaria telfairii]
MATTIQLSAKATPGYDHVDGLSDRSAEKVSELLSANHALYHTRWKATFHNHMVHHLLSLWALGASPSEIQDAWNYNRTYQTSIEGNGPVSASSRNLRDPVTFSKCLGNNDCYFDFLKFFENEVSEKGVPAVIREYLLAGDDRANDILYRIFSDLLHPMIHLGCALEFDQPSLVAESLAASCVHETWTSIFLRPTEEYLKAAPEGVPSRPLLEVLEGMRNDPVVKSGVKATDPFNKIAGGLLQRVPTERLVSHLSALQVRPDAASLERETLTMMYTSAYVVGAAQHPGKIEALDFVTLHSATLAVHYPVLMAQDWLTEHEKARLLETKLRVDAIMYAGCGSPALHAERVHNYAPRRPGDSWPELIRRAIVYQDEGHAAKLLRALHATYKLGDPPAGFPIAREDLVKIAHMAMDSIEAAFEEGAGPRVPEAVVEDLNQRVGGGAEMVVNNMTRWVFYGGLEGAWRLVPDL